MTIKDMAAKKRTRKRVAKKHKSTRVVYHSTKEIKVEQALIENFIGLQKVMVKLSSKFETLSGQISRLLQLFESSAKSLARRELSFQENPDTKKILDRLEGLSAQSGLIGKGLALMHETRSGEGMPQPPMPRQRNMFRGPPMQRPMQPQMQSTTEQQANISGMSPSIMPSTPPDASDISSAEKDLRQQNQPERRTSFTR